VRDTIRKIRDTVTANQVAGAFRRRQRQYQWAIKTGATAPRSLRVVLVPHRFRSDASEGDHNKPQHASSHVMGTSKWLRVGEQCVSDEDAHGGLSFSTSYATLSYVHNIFPALKDCYWTLERLPPILGNRKSTTLYLIIPLKVENSKGSQTISPFGFPAPPPIGIDGVSTLHEKTGPVCRWTCHSNLGMLTTVL
jgi:hypothetical protein